MFKPAGTRRWLVWSGLSAVLLVLGLLAAFHQVVSGAVRQGEAWRQAQAVQKDASWRCKASRRLEERRQCLAVLAGGKS